MIIHQEMICTVADLIGFLQQVDRPHEVFVQGCNWASLVGTVLSDGSEVVDVVLSEREIEQ